MTAEELSDSLYEVVSILESCNMTELLPTNTFAWYQAKRLEEDPEELEKIPALEFLERAIQKAQ